MDRDNRELHEMVAQEAQQRKLAEDQTDGCQRATPHRDDQLARTQTDKQEADKKTQAMAASLHRQSGVSITPNNSLLQTLPVIHSPGVPGPTGRRRHPGRVPGGQLFEHGSARLVAHRVPISSPTPPPRSAAPIPTRSSASRATPTPMPSAAASSGRTTSSRSPGAMAVYDLLVGSGRYRADQVFVVGPRPNHPVVSNATPEASSEPSGRAGGLSGEAGGMKEGFGD